MRQMLNKAEKEYLQLYVSTAGPGVFGDTIRHELDLCERYLAAKTGAEFGKLDDIGTKTAQVIETPGISLFEVYVIAWTLQRHAGYRKMYLGATHSNQTLLRVALPSGLSWISLPGCIRVRDLALRYDGPSQLRRLKIPWNLWDRTEFVLVHLLRNSRSDFVIEDLCAL